jgi:hypothetical protein
MEECAELCLCAGDKEAWCFREGVRQDLRFRHSYCLPRRIQGRGYTKRSYRSGTSGASLILSLFNIFPCPGWSDSFYRTLGLLETAHKFGGARLKRFVVLGSAVAVLNSYMEAEGTRSRDYDEDDWNPVSFLALISLL